ncbi:DUF1810 domain-containing protein [Parafilimonas sp.]|uniref:DUF1810 domain-containing protein n=1 Tax=Parafilimonas sp. TaxID=1969739 RepID=UPI0039E63204
MAQSANDKYNLERFVEAQETEYSIALNEIKNGKKETHWMWFIFPQVLGLGFTSTSMFYGIKDLDEATAYLYHPVLGWRLIEISNVLLTLNTNNVREIFGSSDAVKLRSSMTLFAAVPGADKVFQLVLDRFFGGKPDEKTLQLLGI